MAFAVTGCEERRAPINSSAASTTTPLSVDARHDDLSSLRVNPGGSLRISSSQRLGRSHIAPIVSLMKKRYPELEIWLELVDTAASISSTRVSISTFAWAWYRNRG